MMLVQMMVHNVECNLIIPKKKKINRYLNRNVNKKSHHLKIMGRRTDGEKCFRVYTYEIGTAERGGFIRRCTFQQLVTSKSKFGVIMTNISMRGFSFPPEKERKSSMQM